MNLFLLTPLREGRLRCPASWASIVVFLLTPLREGRLSAKAGKLAGYDYFYSRPCGRGDMRGRPRALPGAFISTHAPAGGATDVERVVLSFGRVISTHAPAGGATIPSRVFVSSMGISTHAPAGGATRCAVREEAPVLLFLLTPLREGRRQFSTSSS